MKPNTAFTFTIISRVAFALPSRHTTLIITGRYATTLTARQPIVLVSCRDGDSGEGGAPSVQLFVTTLSGKTVSIEL